MTLEQIKLYNELENELYKSAERVAKYFVKFNPSYKFIDSWKLYDDEVDGSGTETWAYGGCEDHYVCFDTKWFYATDEELQNYVDSVLEKREKTRRIKRKTRQRKRTEISRIFETEKGV